MKIMNKKFGMTVLLIIAMTIIYLLLDSTIVKYESISDVQFEVFHSYTEMEQFSPIIVEAVATNESVPYIIKEPSFDKKVIKTKVIIDKVIKGELINGVRDDTIFVIENLYIENNGVLPGQTIMAYSESTKLVPGAKYLLHLAWTEKREGYWIVTDIGKMNLDGRDRLEQQIIEKNPNYKALKTQALESRSSWPSEL